jgi:hypothetical protein
MERRLLNQSTANARPGDSCYGSAVETVRLNPAHIVPVVDFEPETLSNIVAHLEASTDFEHFVYREAELDAVWSLLGFSIGSEKDPPRQKALLALRDAAHRAHDLIGQRKPFDAADCLRRLVPV